LRTIQPKLDGFPNPERGFVRWFDDTGDAKAIFTAGHRLVFTRFDLVAHRTTELTPDVIEKISKRLGRAEDAGLKSIVRFQYSNAIGAPDAPERIMLKHVEQLADIFQQYAPSIAVVQAGFIGAWGEWHSSTNGLDRNKSYRALVKALLQAVPVDRCIQVRTPRYKREVAGLRSLSESRAFDGSPAARIGLHNDCFLSGEDDSGTYAPPYRSDRRWAASEGLYVPVGGETCKVSPRTEAHLAIAELRAQRFSFLSQDWHPDVIARWEHAGALSNIEMTLGYRLVIKEIEAPNQVVAGHKLSMSIRVENIGAAAPFNERPVTLLLEQGSRRIEVPLRHVDPRQWLPGTEHQLACTVHMSRSFIGSWRVSLWLPDQSERLRNRPEYALRFANEATWDPAVGTNVVGWIDVVQ
jgi:hypothetical protein